MLRWYKWISKLYIVFQHKQWKCSYYSLHTFFRRSILFFLYTTYDTIYRKLHINQELILIGINNIFCSTPTNIKIQFSAARKIINKSTVEKWKKKKSETYTLYYVSVHFIQILAANTKYVACKSFSLEICSSISWHIIIV